MPGVDAVNTGVLLPSGGDDAVEDPPDKTRVISGARLDESTSFFDFEPGIGIGIGSDISNKVR